MKDSIRVSLIEKLLRAHSRTVSIKDVSTYTCKELIAASERLATMIGKVEAESESISPAVLDDTDIPF